MSTYTSTTHLVHLADFECKSSVLILVLITQSMQYYYRVECNDTQRADLKFLNFPPELSHLHVEYNNSTYGLQVTYH